MKRPVALLVLAAALCLPASASAIIIGVPPPKATILVDGKEIDTRALDVTYDPIKKVGGIVGTLQGTDWEIYVDVTTNPDPFVNYAVGVSNFTAVPITFSFTFTTPVVGGPYNTLTNGFNGTATDRLGDGVTASGIVQKALLDAVNVPAVQLGTYTCTGGPGAGMTIYPCPAGPGFGPVTAGVPSASYASLGVNLNFTISANDNAGFTGRADLVNQVPEPVTTSLVGLGVLALSLARRSRTS